MFPLTESITLNSTQLLKNNVFCLDDNVRDKVILKSNLDYFTILHPNFAKN